MRQKTIEQMELALDSRGETPRNSAAAKPRRRPAETNAQEATTG